VRVARRIDPFLGWSLFRYRLDCDSCARRRRRAAKCEQRVTCQSLGLERGRPHKGRGRGRTCSIESRLERLRHTPGDRGEVGPYLHTRRLRRNQRQLRGAGDLLAPINACGLTKLATERAVLDTHPEGRSCGQTSWRECQAEAEHV